MRDLTDDERRVILALAAGFESGEERNQLMADIGDCAVEETVPDGSILVFNIVNYVRPQGDESLYRTKDGYRAQGFVKDADGAEMEVLLFKDKNNRLYELEIVRYSDGPVMKPNWHTFRTI